jgi:arylsulfatase
VLIAQGGRTEGFSVYVADGKLAFAIRRGGQLSVITAAAALPTATSTAVADLDSDGAMTLRVDGKAVASGKADGALLKTPVEGLQVGRDAGATVGDYAGPFPFAGRLGEVSIELRGPGSSRSL